MDEDVNRQIRTAAIAIVLTLVGCGGGSGEGSGTDSSDGFNVSITGPTQVNRGAVGTFMAVTDDNETEDFEWVVVDSPEGSLASLEVADGVVQFPAGQVGQYSIQLTVTSGDNISAPSVFVTEVIDAGPQPPRLPIAGELEFINEISLTNIQNQLRSPTSFQLVGETVFVTLPEDSFAGGLVVDFDAANAFGTLLRETAVCHFSWTGYFWGVELNENLQLCTFLG